MKRTIGLDGVGGSFPAMVEDCYSINNNIFSVPVSFKFGGTPDMGATSIGEALIALDAAVRRSSSLITSASGVSSDKDAICRVSVDELKKGSFIERVIVDVILGGNENAHQMLLNLASQADRFSPEAVPLLISGVVGSALTYGAVYAIKRFKKNKEEPKAMINAYNSIVINTSKGLKISDSAFKALIERVKGPVSFSKYAVTAMHPGRAEGASGLIIGNEQNGIIVPKEALDEMPSVSEIEAQEEEKLIAFEGLDLIIVASDKEHSKSGWAAYLPSDHAFAGVRIKLVIGETVAPSILMYKEHVKCSGQIHLGFSARNNTFRPTKIFVSKAE